MYRSWLLHRSLLLSITDVALRDKRGVTPSAMRRRMAVTVLLACAAVALAAPAAMSAGAPTTGSNSARSLWRAYPLEQTVTTAGGSAVPPTDSPQRAAARDPAPERGGGTPWITLLLVAIAVGLSLATMVVLRRRSAADRRRAGFFDAGGPSAVGAGAASRATPGTHRPAAASERPMEAPARAGESPESTIAVPAHDATAQARAPVAPATEDTAGVSEAAPSAAEVVPAAPEESPAPVDAGSSSPEVVPTGPGANGAEAGSSPSEQVASDALAESPPASGAAPEAPEATPDARESPPEALDAPGEDPEDAPRVAEENAPRADGEAASAATPVRVPSRDPQQEGAGASAASGRRPRRRSPAASRPQPPGPRPARSDDAARTAASKSRPRRERPAAGKSGAAPEAGLAVPPASADDGSIERDASRARKVAAGPICQIRWLPKGRGSCFSAVMIDDDGNEHTLATSPSVKWLAPTPPEQTLEAEVAVRRLAKTLRESGWRPMRTKGKDYNQPQWYTRRFRYPVALAEGDRSGVGDRGASAS